MIGLDQRRRNYVLTTGTKNDIKTRQEILQEPRT